MSLQKARVSLGQPSDGIVFVKGATKRMPVGLACIAASVARAGHEVNVVDASLHDLTTEETVHRLLANDPHIIGFTCTTPLYHRATEAIKLIKQLSPKTAIVMGGPHVSYLPRTSLETSGAHFICIGEGEVSMPAIVECVMTGRDPGTIDSIAYSWNGYEGMTKTYLRRVAEKREENKPGEKYAEPIDLNNAPWPARGLFEYDKYHDLSRGKKGPQTGAMFSRGCPGKCAFCGAADTLVRWRAIENVLAELEEIKCLNIPNLFIMDDTYTVNRKRVLMLSHSIVDRGLADIDKSVQLRLDQIDEEICDAMYASGIRHVHPGIESGNEMIIKAIGKGPRESKRHMLEKIRLLQQYPWRVRCSYVFGMPGETEDQILETIAFAAELNADENAFSLLVPYPDSPLWDFAMKEGKVSPYMDFSKFLYYRTVGVNLSAVPTNILLALNQFAYEYVGNNYWLPGDVSISSGNRPFSPAFTPKDIPNLPSVDFSARHGKILNRTLRNPEECTLKAVKAAFEEYKRKHPPEELKEEAIV